MPRGIKTCPSCGKETGARTLKCKSCNHKFQINYTPPGIKKRNGKPCNWQELMPGDKIKVLMGSGPYWPAKSEDEEDIPLAYYGHYKVLRVCKKDQGIHAYSTNGYGHAFIYMGPKVKTKYGIIRCPHKIRKVV